MEIINLTPQIGTLTGDIYRLTNVDYNNKVSFKLLFKNIQHKDISAGCASCTKAIVEQKGEDVEVTITYTPNRGASKGVFSKSFTEHYKDGQRKITFTGNAK